MDPYSEATAAFYDAEHDGLQDDLRLYRNLVVQGPVLELGAGTGRITAALVADGHEVWAVERSPAMLARARRRLDSVPGVHLVPAGAEDLQTAGLNRHFRVALLPLNFLWHLPDSSGQLHVLQVVRRLLVPRGLLVVDLTNPLAMADRAAQGEVRQRFHTTTERGSLICTSATWDDQGEQTLAVDLIYDETDAAGQVHRTTAQVTFRYLYRFELELLLLGAGFELAQLYGSYDLDPYTAESSNLVAVARAPDD